MKNLLRPTPVVGDTALLLARVVVGVVLIAHGHQKLFTNGLDGTAQGFEGMGIPAPRLAATFAALTEFVGGGLLVLGALTPLVGVLVAFTMAGAFWYAHRDAGLFATDGGWEYVVVLGVFGLLFAGVGAGRFSVDAFVAGRSEAAPAERELENASSH